VIVVACPASNYYLTWYIMKILFVLENYYPHIGGAETLFRTLVHSLAEEGNEITIVTRRVSKRPFPREENKNIRIRRYPLGNRYLFTFLAFFPVLKHAWKCDLIHTTSYNAALPAFLGGKLLGKKVVITFHEVWGKLWFRLPFMNRFSERLHYLFEQMLLRLPFDRFVAVSNFTKKELIANGVAKKRVEVIYNGIEYDKFEPPHKGSFSVNGIEKQRNQPFTFTYFGRIGISKGIDLLLEAFRRLIKEHPRHKLKMIIPTTPRHLFNEVMDLIEQKELGSSIILLHHLSLEALKEELIQSDCVTIQSHSEGFCYAAVEAIALGVPLISSDKAALKEVVSGTFIKMKEQSVEGLLEAMKKAIRNEWTTNPKRIFRLNDTVNNYLDLYEVVTGRSIVQVKELVAEEVPGMPTEASAEVGSR